MFVRELGEIKVIGERNPVGVILRMKNGCVVLERHYYDGEIRVLHEFSKGLTLKEHLKQCIVIAREYEAVLSEPIHIEGVSMGDIELCKLNTPKKECLKCMVENSNIRPWNYVSMQKCKNCSN